MTAGDAGTPGPGTPDGRPAREPLVPDDPHGFEDVVIPDDLSGLTGAAPATPRISIVLTQVATPEALAATCALHKLDVVAAPSPVGAFAVTLPGEGETVAAQVSATVTAVPLILLHARDGRVEATRWEGGAQMAKVPAALVLGGGAPEDLEGLLFGTTTIERVSGTVRSADISRWKAIRLLSAAAKRGGSAS